MDGPASEQATAGSTPLVNVAVPTRPPAPPGMVAVPAAALSGRQQHAAQQAGAQIGVLGGLAAGGGGDIVTGAVAGGLIGQQIGQYQRHAAMNDPNAPMVFVDENSRAGRRAIRREGRRERRAGRWGSHGGGDDADKAGAKQGRGWLTSLFRRGTKNIEEREPDGGEEAARETELGVETTEETADARPRDEVKN